MKTRFLSKVPLISNRTKILISFSLLIFALILSILYPDNFDRKICLIAMLLSFVGDITLNYTTLEKRSPSLLYAGAIFFMTSHLIYASAYYTLISSQHLSFINTGAYLAYYLMALLFIVYIVIVYLFKKSLKLSTCLIFVLYLAIISINFITICSYSWNFHSLSFIGAISFLISDCIIGIETIFKIKSDTLRKLVWIFYPIGQIMIIYCR